MQAQNKLGRVKQNSERSSLLDVMRVKQTLFQSTTSKNVKRCQVLLWRKIQEGALSIRPSKNVTFVNSE